MKTEVELSLIAKIVAEYFDCEVIDLFQETRVRNIVLRRQWFHYLARKFNPEKTMSFSVIGSYYYDVLNRKYDHATVMHSCKKIKYYVDIYRNDLKIEQTLILRIREANRETDILPNDKIKHNDKIYHCTPNTFNSVVRYSQNHTR